MDLVDIQGSSEPVRALFHPGGVAEPVSTHIPDDGGGVGAQLHPVPVRVTVVDELSGLIIDPVFVHHSRTCFF